MKKIILFIILTVGFSHSYCQWSVKLYKVRDVVPFNSTYDQITVMEIDNFGNIWFNLENAKEGAGMGKFTGKEWLIFNVETDLIFQELGLHVNAFAFEGEIVWIGTDNGLARFNGISPTGWNIYNSQNSPILNKITALTVDNKSIKWIGCSDGIILSFDGSKWMTLDKYSGTGNIVNDLEADIDGNLWIARNGTPGLVKFTYDNPIEFAELSDIRDVMIDDKGLVNAVSKDKLIIIQNDKIVETAGPDPRLECELYEVENHPEGLFVSSNKGILQKIGAEFKLISKDNSSLPDLVPQDNYLNVPLLFDRADGLWFSFIYQGITGVSYASIGKMYKLSEPVPLVIPVPVNKPSYRFCYGESLTLDAGLSDVAYYVWDDLRTTNRTYTIFDTKTISYSVILNEDCVKDTLTTCTESSQVTSQTVSIDVIAQHVYEDEVPCVATVTTDYKNLVAWERTPYKGTASYDIFKETTPDVFEFLDNIPVGQLSVYKDLLSDARTGSSKYKISSLDTCGNESGPSIYHKTMFLNLTKGTDTNDVILTWENYAGIPFLNYIIFRGTHPDSLTQIATVPLGQNTWMDDNVIGRHYYAIGVQLPGICAPAETGKKADSGPYSHSMSNIEDNRFQTFIGEQKINEILAYPNPFNHWTQIDFENPLKYPYQLTVIDMSGKIVRQVNNITDNKVILLRENLPQGFYLFELKGDNYYRGKFAIR